MKRLLSLMTFTGLVAVGLMVVGLSPSEALYTGNPTLTSTQGQFSIAADLDIVRGKDLELTVSDDRTGASASGVGEIEFTGLMVRPIYSVLDNLTVHGRFGLLFPEALDTGFGFGGGAQYVHLLSQLPGWRIGGSVDLFFFSADFEGGAGDLSYFELQFTVAAGYEIEQLPELVPYAGVVLDFVNGDESVTVINRNFDFDIKHDKLFGLVAGATYEIAERFKVDGQVRLINETAITLSITYAL